MDPYPSSTYVDLPSPSRHVTVWQLITSFLQFNPGFPAYLFFSIVVAMTISLVGLNVIYTYCYNYLYEVLQSYDKQQGVVHLIFVLFALLSFYLLLAAYRFCTKRFLGPRLRRWLTAQCTDHVLQKNKRYAKEEIGSLVNFSIDFSMGLIGIITTSLMFIYYLLLFSDGLGNTLGKWSAPWVSEYVIWVGVIYALMGIFFTLKCSRPASALRGANFACASKIPAWLRMGCNQMLLILPLLMVFPAHFEILFLAGWFLQSLQAFNRVQSSFPSIINAYSLLPIVYAASNKAVTAS